MTSAARPIVVGVDPARPDRGALELAGTLGRLLASPVLVTAVHPPYGGEKAAQRAAEAGLERLAGLDAHALPIASTSPARGLVDLAEDRGALLIVVGAAHHLAGVTARVLNGAPCAVAVAPRGYAGGPLERIGVAFCDSPEGREALRAGVAAAAAARAALRAVSVIEPVAWTAELWPDLITPDRIERYRRGEERRLQDAADEACGPDAVRVEVLEGRLEALEDATARFDLVVCGSRGYGPVQTVLLGSVSHALAFHGRCPVLILPRGAGADLTARLEAAATVLRGGAR